MEYIVAMLLIAPIFLNIILLTELLNFRRSVLKSIEMQNRALSTLIDAQCVIMNTASNIYSIVMEERE